MESLVDAGEPNEHSRRHRPECDATECAGSVAPHPVRLVGVGEADYVAPPAREQIAYVRNQLRSAASVRWPDQETSTSSSTEKASSATELGSQINAIPTASTGITSPA